VSQPSPSPTHPQWAIPRHLSDEDRVDGEATSSPAGISVSPYTLNRRNPKTLTRYGRSSPTTGAASGRGGTVTLYLDGKPVGEGRVDGTQPMIFSGDETTDVGADTATPVSDD